MWSMNKAAGECEVQCQEGYVMSAGGVRCVQEAGAACRADGLEDVRNGRWVADGTGGCEVSCAQGFSVPPPGSDRPTVCLEDCPTEELGRGVRWERDPISGMCGAGCGDENMVVFDGRCVPKQGLSCGGLPPNATSWNTDGMGGCITSCRAGFVPGEDGSCVEKCVGEPARGATWKIDDAGLCTQECDDAALTIVDDACVKPCTAEPPAGAEWIRGANGECVASCRVPGEVIWDNTCVLATGAPCTPPAGAGPTVNGRWLATGKGGCELVCHSGFLPPVIGSVCRAKCRTDAPYTNDPDTGECINLTIPRTANPGSPQYESTNPKPAQPQTGQGQPQTGQGQPQTGQGQPQTGQGQPQTPTGPAYGSSDSDTHWLAKYNKLDVPEDMYFTEPPLESDRIACGVVGNYCLPFNVRTAANAEECAKKCSMKPGCDAFTFYKKGGFYSADGATCKLMSANSEDADLKVSVDKRFEHYAAPDAKWRNFKRPGETSRYRQIAGGQTYLLEPPVGKTTCNTAQTHCTSEGVVTASSLEDCAEKCTTDPRCRVFSYYKQGTYHDNPGANCKLMAASNNSYNTDVKAGREIETWARRDHVMVYTPLPNNGYNRRLTELEMSVATMDLMGPGVKLDTDQRTKYVNQALAGNDVRLKCPENTSDHYWRLNEYDETCEAVCRNTSMRFDVAKNQCQPVVYIFEKDTTSGG
jgi:hypothetical protein